MKLCSILMCCLFLLSCDSDEEPDINCALFDPVISNLFIKLVDAEGTNLIENQTYKASDIWVTFNDHIITGVVFDNVPSLENLITLNLMGVDGNNTFTIHLSETVSDTLIMNLTLDSQICDFSYYTLNSATYNGVVQTIEEQNGNYLITVLK